MGWSLPIVILAVLPADDETATVVLEHSENLLQQDMSRDHHGDLRQPCLHWDGCAACLRARVHHRHGHRTRSEALAAAGGTQGHFANGVAAKTQLLGQCIGLGAPPLGPALLSRFAPAVRG